MIGRPFRMEWHEEDTQAALKKAYQSQRDVSIRTRLHVLWLLRCGWRITAAAEAVGVHYRSAQRWVESYREGGLNEVVSRKMGGVGQPRFLSEDQDKQTGRGGWERTFQDRRRDRGLGGVGVWGEVQGEQHIRFVAAAGVFTEGSQTQT